jgi:pentatricopeptide repeat protein
VSFGSVLKAFAREKKMDRVWAIWEDMKRHNITPLVTTYNLLCDACTTNGQIDRIPMLLVDMDKREVEPNLITFSTLVKGHCQRGDMESAFDILRQMRKTTDLKPDEIMYNTLLDGCGTHGMVDEGKKILAQMQEENIKPSNYTLSVLVKLMGNARQLDEVFDIVASTTERYGFKANAHVYANLVQACVSNKKLSTALQLLEGMAKDKQQPDIRTYSTTLRACMNTGKLEEATRLARAALGLQGHEPYPCRNPDNAPKGARLPDNLLNELIKVLRNRGYFEKLGNPLAADIQKNLPHIKIAAFHDQQSERRTKEKHPWRKSS